MTDSLYDTAGICEMDGHVCIAATSWGCIGPVGSALRWKVEADIHLVEMTDQPFRMVTARYNEADGTVVALCSLR